MKKVIFVAGIHGVGKTTVCNYFSDHYKIPHYSASTLISERKMQYFSKNKKVEHIEENQDFLIEAIDSLDINDSYLLLDGHFCLLNTEGKITRIPEKTFKKLSPIGIVVLVDSEENILLKIENRDGYRHDITLITSLQQEELTYSKEVSDTLHIPYFLHKMSDDIHTLLEFFDSINNIVSNVEMGTM